MIKISPVFIVIAGVFSCSFQHSLYLNRLVAISDGISGRWVD
jgi:hypothetical protein